MSRFKQPQKWVQMQQNAEDNHIPLLEPAGFLTRGIQIWFLYASSEEPVNLLGLLKDGCVGATIRVILLNSRLGRETVRCGYLIWNFKQRAELSTQPVSWQASSKKSIISPNVSTITGSIHVKINYKANWSTCVIGCHCIMLIDIAPAGCKHLHPLQDWIN